MMMSLKAFLALLAGLVIQLSQVPPCLAATAAEPCAGHRQAMSCCKDLKSCPCEAKNEQAPKPAPLVPESVGFKGWVAPVPMPHEQGFTASVHAQVALFFATQTEPHAGFIGVPLSVAFCRFVI
ncbi:MAG: hypothetical protein ORN51_07925 [Akkermansiaceae bacterium]|nr:hypothetical protein [Akkermansiaceae bacterium]